MSKKRRTARSGEPIRTKPLPDLQKQAPGSLVEANKAIPAAPKPEKPATPLWQTLLTQVAPTLAAIAALLGVLNQVGVFQKPTPIPTATAMMTTTATLAPLLPAETATPTLTLTLAPTFTPTLTPTFTPTFTLTPTSTVTETPLPADCLSSQTWQFYPDEAVNQQTCLDLVPYFMSYDGHEFDFNAQGFEEINVWGVSRRIPRDVEIEANFMVDSIAGGGRLWLAISSDANPLKDSVVLMILPDRYVALRAMRNGVESTLASPHVPSFDDFQRQHYKVEITLDGNRMTVKLNDVFFASAAINFTSRRLFIGYQAVRNPQLTVSAQLQELVVGP